MRGGGNGYSELRETPQVYGSFKYDVPTVCSSAALMDVMGVAVGPELEPYVNPRAGYQKQR